MKVERSSTPSLANLAARARRALSSAVAAAPRCTITL